jgi:hypothetical protein
MNMTDGRRSCRFHIVDVFAVEPLTGNASEFRDSRDDHDGLK